MKVNELLERITNKNFDIEKELEIKKYIPVIQKRQFAVDVISACANDNYIDNYIIVDKFKMNIYFHMNLLKLYTNLEISTDFDETVIQYDMLCEKSILNRIINIIKDDYNELENILKYELDNLLEENSLECQVAKVVTKAHEIIDVVSDKISSIDLDGILPEGVDVKQLFDFVDMLN